MGSASQNRFATLLICATKADQNLWKITGVSLFTAAGPHPRGYSRLRFARRCSATTAFFQCDSLAHVPILAASLRSPLVSDDSILYMGPSTSSPAHARPHPSLPRESC